MTRLILTVGGTELTVDYFGGMQERLQDMTEANQTIQMVMLRSAHENFLAGGRPTSWVPLSTATIKRRRNQDKGSIEILRDTGYLMQSLSPDYTNAYSIRHVARFESRIGTNRPGARAHQEGLNGLPERKFLVHQAQDIEDYKTIIRDHIFGFGE